jgi:hypothetical protein
MKGETVVTLAIIFGLALGGFVMKALNNVSAELIKLEQSHG